MSASSSASAAPVAAPAPAAEAPDVLDVDLVTVPGLQFAAVSFVSPVGAQKADFFGLKIRGAWGSREEAEHGVKRLHKSDGAFDIFIVDMYKWLLVPPPADKLDSIDTRYSESYLNELVTGYHANQLEAKSQFEQRKRQIMLEGLDKNLSAEERITPPTLEASSDLAADLAAADPYIGRRIPDESEIEIATEPEPEPEETEPEPEETEKE